MTDSGSMSSERFIVLSVDFLNDYFLNVILNKYILDTWIVMLYIILSK